MRAWYLPWWVSRACRLTSPEGVQPAVVDGADPAGVVDLQPGAGFQAHGVQADVIGERLPAGGEQHLVGLHLAAVIQGQRDRPGAARTAYRGDGDADPHVHPGLGQAATDELPGERLHPGQQAVGLGQQRDLSAQALPGAGHLDPDPAAADDGQPARHGAGVGGLPVGPRARLGQPGQLGQGRAAAGADHDGLPGGQRHRPAVGGRHRDPPVAVQPAVAADQVGTEAFQPGGLPLVVPVGHPFVPALEHRRGVHRPGDRLARRR